MKVWTLKGETREQKYGAGACECTRLLSDTEHWHHLRGYWTLITSVINHQALLPDADGLGRRKKMFSLGLDFYPPILHVWKRKLCSLLALGCEELISSLQGKVHSGTLFWDKKGNPSLGGSGRAACLCPVAFQDHGLCPWPGKSAFHKVHSAPIPQSSLQLTWRSFF